MSDTTAPWAVWDDIWIRRDTFPERPSLDGLSGRILTHDTPEGRQSWRVSGGELVEIESRLCAVCREKPVGRGGQMCPGCFDRISTRAAMTGETT